MMPSSDTYSISVTDSILAPIHDPLLDSLHVCLHVLGRVARQFHHYFFLVAFSRFFQQYLHDLRVKILLQFIFQVLSTFKSIVKLCGICPQNNHEINPILGENIADMPIYYKATLRNFILKRVEKLC